MAMNLPGGRVSLLPHWPGWRHLPRETRDTLFLLGVIAWTILPHLPHLPLWCSGLAAVVLLWRTRLALTQDALPRRWLVTAGLALAVGLTWLSFDTLLGKQPGVTLAVVLMALKTLELRARRDAFVVFFLGFFVVLTNFLYSQSLPVAVAMLVSVWGLLTALVLAHMPVGQPSLRQAGRLALRTALLGAPIMVLLFVLFPRIGPLWGVPQDAAGSTGLSGTMRMGSMAEIALDDSIALRVKFMRTGPPPETLYFRGPVLSHFDGSDWRATPAALEVEAKPELRLQGPATAYEVTMEPSRLAVLPLLEATTEIAPIDGFRLRRRDDLSWSSSRVVNERLRFDASAHLGFSHGPLAATSALDGELQLPPGYNPATRAWAEALRRRVGADAGALAAAVLDHVRRAGFSYTLVPGRYGEADPRTAIDEFWLGRREGFCEHFAASFVVIMRSMDVPARVVTGYQGADPLPVDGYYIVRQSHAHAWAEYWQAGRGWVRADPTAAVAPERIGRSRNLVPVATGVGATLRTLNPQLIAGLRAFWERVDNRWNQWVLNYARGQQLDLMKKIGFASPSWEDLALLLIGLLSSLSLGAAGWAWWERNRLDPWQRQSQALRRLLQHLGLEAPVHHTPRGLAEQVRQRFGAAGHELAGLLANLELQRYGPTPAARPSATWLRAVRKEVRRLGR